MRGPGRPTVESLVAGPYEAATGVPLRAALLAWDDEGITLRSMAERLRAVTGYGPNRDSVRRLIQRYRGNGTAPAPAPAPAHGHTDEHGRTRTDTDTGCTDQEQRAGKADGGRQKADGGRQKEEGGRQKAEGGRQSDGLPAGMFERGGLGGFH